jgi:hypothetical protein
MFGFDDAVYISMAVMAAASAASAGYSMYAGYNASKNANEMAERNAQLAQDQADREANLKAQEAAIKLENQQDNNKRNLAFLEGKYAKSGVSLMGTPTTYMSDVDTMSNINLKTNAYFLNASIDNIRATGDVNAWNDLSQGLMLSNKYKVGAIQDGINMVGDLANVGLQAGREHEFRTTGTRH